MRVEHLLSHGVEALWGVMLCGCTGSRADILHVHSRKAHVKKLLLSVVSLDHDSLQNIM